MKLSKWVILKVLCSDGVERIGMLQEGDEDYSEERVIEHTELGSRWAHGRCAVWAEKMNMEIFDNDRNYTPIEY